MSGFGQNVDGRQPAMLPGVEAPSREIVADHCLLGTPGSALRVAALTCVLVVTGAGTARADDGAPVSRASVQESEALQEWAVAAHAGELGVQAMLAIEVEYGVKPWMAVAGWGGYAGDVPWSIHEQAGVGMRLRYPLLLPGSRLLVGLSAGPSYGTYGVNDDEASVDHGLWMTGLAHAELRLRWGPLLRLYAGGNKLVYGDCVEWDRAPEPCDEDVDADWLPRIGLALGYAF